MSSLAFKTFNENINSIFNSYVNFQLLKHLKDFSTTHVEGLKSGDLEAILKAFDKIKGSDRTINHLFIGIIASMELYLKERIFEEFRSNRQGMINFLKDYQLDQKLGIQHVIDGPEKLTEDILNSLIYHNIEKVSRVYKITYGFNILEFVNVKALKTDIKLRHNIVHSASKTRERELVINSGFLFTLDRVSRFIESIDYYIEHKKHRQRFTSYWSKLDSFFRPLYDLKSASKIMSLALSKINFLNTPDENKLVY